MKQILVGSILKHLCALVVLDAGGLIAVTPAFAAENPVRWTTGGSVWSIQQQAFDTLIDSGEVTDRGLEGGLNRSGWTASEVGAGMSKSYNVDLRAVTRYLYSNAGVDFLKTATLAGWLDLLDRHHAGPSHRFPPRRSALGGGIRGALQATDRSVHLPALLVHVSAGPDPGQQGGRSLPGYTIA